MGGGDGTTGDEQIFTNTLFPSGFKCFVFTQNEGVGTTKQVYKNWRFGKKCSKP